MYRPEPFVPIVRLLALVPRQDVSSRFYVEYINERVNFSLESTGVPQLTAPQVRPYLLALPPVQEQRAIARVLEDADDLVNALDRLITKKMAMKKGVLQELLTGRTRLPGFTAAWTDGVFEDLASPAKERATPQDVPRMTPLVDLEQIEGGTGRLVGTSHASVASSLKAVFRSEDVLFGKLRAYLRKYWYAEFAGLCTTEIWVLRPRPGVHGRFVRYLVETDGFIETASGAYGTHMPRSDWGTVRAFPVAIPPLDEQAAIASTLADIDAEIVTLGDRVAKARAIKAGMMQELLTGRTRLLAGEGAA